MGILFIPKIMNAQGSNEFRVSVSDATFLNLGSSFSESLSNAIISGISGVKLEDAQVRNSAMFTVGFRHNMTNRIKVGADVSYFDIDRKFNVGAEKFKRATTYIGVASNVEFSYIKSSKFDFYSSISLGYLNTSTKEKQNTANPYSVSDDTFCWQVTPAGLRWSATDNFGLFAEVGFGYKGIGSLGLSYKF